MSIPIELEFRCQKCPETRWVTPEDARSFKVACGRCGSVMKKTGQRKEDGEMVQPPEPKVKPTGIPENFIDKPKLTV